MHAINELPDFLPTDLITATTSKTWFTHKGRELVSVGKGGTLAKVHPASCDADELRALAQACVEAAAEMTRCDMSVKVRVAE